MRLYLSLVALAGSARRAAVIVNALDRVRDIPIERRDGRELSHIEGRTLSGALEKVAILPEVSEVANHGFDVTPARLVTANAAFVRPAKPASCRSTPRSGRASPRHFG
mgnify:CR=1 FL=1